MNHCIIQLIFQAAIFSVKCRSLIYFAFRALILISAVMPYIVFHIFYSKRDGKNQGRTQWYVASLVIEGTGDWQVSKAWLKLIIIARVVLPRNEAKYGSDYQPLILAFETCQSAVPSITTDSILFCVRPWSFCKEYYENIKKSNLWITA